MSSDRYLVDVNIFLEILLQQSKKEKAKTFLSSHGGELGISDFSLHSIGVLLFSENRELLYREFINDSLPNLDILPLGEDTYEEVVTIHTEYKLDFDDSYQTAVAHQHGRTIVTFDKDFRKVKRFVQVEFL